MCNLINTHTLTHTHLDPPQEDQCEWHRMPRMTGPDCAVMCNLINTHILRHTHTRKRKKRRQERVGSVATNPDNIENRKEAGGEAQGTHCRA